MQTNVTQVLSRAAVLTLLVLAFQNCGKTQFTGDSVSLSSKATGVADTSAVTNPSGDPNNVAVSDTPLAGISTEISTEIPHEPEDDSVAFSGICADFRGSPMPSQIPASAQDVVVSSGSHQLVIPLAKDLSVSNHSGSIEVKLSATASLQNISGQILLRSLHVLQLHNISGNECVQSPIVDRLDNISGHTKIIAAQIGEILNTSGSLHIYGAVVKSVRRSSGHICLHDGAVVLNQSENSGNIFIGDCSQLP